MMSKLNRLKKIKKEDFVVLLLIGVLILVVALPSEKQTKRSLDEADSVSIETFNSAEGETYGEYWEKKLEHILPAMEGVGRVKVLVSLKDDGELFVEKDTPVTRSMTKEKDSNGGTREITEYSGSETTLMVTQTDGKQIPYVIRERKPKVTGILVLAQGGDNDRIRKEITCLLQALFDIEAHKIVVAKMKTG